MITERKLRLWSLSFIQVLKQVREDAMLFVACFAPFLAGAVIKFGIPAGERLLTDQFRLSELLKPYYLMFDLFLAVMTPMMFCFISAMIILSEIDDKISNYLAVTPLGKSGYVISRLGFPMMIALAVTLFMTTVFSLTRPAVPVILGNAALASLLGFIISLMVISLSSNKVEGMAVTKLTGIFTLGIPVPFFITGKLQYAAFVLPSFWLAKFSIEGKFIFLLNGILISVIWIYLLWRKFLIKIK